MNRLELLRPILLGVVITPLCYLLGMFLSAGGHDYLFLNLLFPYAMLLRILFNDLAFYIGMAFIAFQYPLYGVVLALFRATGRYKMLVIGVALGHFFTIILCLVFDLYREN